MYLYLNLLRMCSHDGIVPERPVRLFRQLYSLHHHVLLSVLHGGQGGWDDWPLMLRARAPVSLLSTHQPLLSVLRPHRHPRIQEHRGLSVRRLLRALVLWDVRPVPGGSRDRRAGYDRYGWRLPSHRACLKQRQQAPVAINDDDIIAADEFLLHCHGCNLPLDAVFAYMYFILVDE